jgi:hypothetical protein
VKSLNPDTLRPAQGDELLERQARTGEYADGKTVECRPDLMDPRVVHQASRVLCVSTPYAACLSCRHHRFEYFFAVQEENVWVQCPRWNRPLGTGAPDFYTPVWMSECRAKPYVYCPQCPSREELAELQTDKQKEGWFERYKKLTKER